MENKSENLVEKLKKSTVFKVTSGYAILAFVTVQIASLVSSSFGLSQEFMQNIIIVFLVILPFIAITAWAASSKFSTVKILGIVFVILFTGYGGGSYVWVNNFILPDLKKALEEDNYVAAWDQVNRLNAYAPFLYNAENVDSEISLPVSINVTEPGVQISWKPYTVTKDYEWRYIGTTPLIEFTLPRGVINLKLEKKGFETRYITEANPSFTFNNHPIPPTFDLTPLGMYPEGTIPEGMVPVDAGNFIPALIGEGVEEYNLGTFYIDKNEVTNKEFKEFVDAKGYEVFQYWTDMDFIYNGESLSWDEAKELMVDSTGINGPANWEIGSYKDGEENLPVTGISWYEAQAYAKYKGNILPPMYHWAKAAFPITEIAAPISPVLLKKSNFSNKSVSQVGSNGFGPYGTYDMAGNVSEWSWNIFGGRGLTLGGNFSDPAYSASSATPSPRFIRSANIGFRTVRLLNPRDLNPFGDPIERSAPKPSEFFKPFTDEEFKLYSRNFEVGPIELNTKSIYIDETHPVWIKERVQLNVGYNNEKMDVLIFRPKNVVGSVDTVILYPGANYYRTPPSIDEVDPGEYGLDFVIKSGRALIWPAYKGSMNRITNMNISFPSTQEHMRLFRQLLSHWTVDTSRTIDFLETRKDEFNENIFYVGMSYGGLFTPHVLLFENRFKAAVFYVGGAWPGIPPLADGKNHIPRIKLPILMLNGEQDYLVPATAPKAMYAALGTPEEDKKLIFYESGHWPLPRNQMIKETLKWFENYRD